jgi:hypothetical protein
MRRASQISSPRRKARAQVRGSIRLDEVMVIAEKEGLLRGERTEIVRGRMPEALVARAKKRTGIHPIRTSLRWHWQTLLWETITRIGCFPAATR